MLFVLFFSMPTNPRTSAIIVSERGTINSVMGQSLLFEFANVQKTCETEVAAYCPMYEGGCRGYEILGSGVEGGVEASRLASKVAWPSASFMVSPSRLPAGRVPLWWL